MIRTVTRRLPRPATLSPSRSLVTPSLPRSPPSRPGFEHTVDPQTSRDSYSAFKAPGTRHQVVPRFPVEKVPAEKEVNKDTIYELEDGHNQRTERFVVVKAQGRDRMLRSFLVASQPLGERKKAEETSTEQLLETFVSQSETRRRQDQEEFARQDALEQELMQQAAREAEETRTFFKDQHDFLRRLSVSMDELSYARESAAIARYTKLNTEDDEG